MGKHTDLISSVHKSTKRDYLERVNSFPKAEAATLAKQWGKDYWDGDRNTGYGGYHYDGRWQPVAESIIAQYQLKPGQTVLDVGCGKGFLLYELQKCMPGLHVIGLDVSSYAIGNAKSEIAQFLQVGCASELPFSDKQFDLVISINTLHNLYAHELDKALREIERVSSGNKYICVESYRNEVEKVNLLYWQLTCEMFCTPDEWQWWFNHTGYKGDYSFIYFE